MVRTTLSYGTTLYVTMFMTEKLMQIGDEMTGDF
jgi:hypothetical protein